jgi:hypothetical protein
MQKILDIIFNGQSRRFVYMPSKFALARKEMFESELSELNGNGTRRMKCYRSFVQSAKNSNFRHCNLLLCNSLVPLACYLEIRAFENRFRE